MGSIGLYMVGMLFTDFFVPSWESNKFIQTISTHSFFNLMFRSIIIIIYSDDRCSAESKILAYFKSEEDMLWVWFRYSIYQLILIRIIGYFVLYIQANYEKFNINKLLIRKKNLKNNFHLMKSSNERVNFDETKINGNEKINYDNKELNKLNKLVLKVNQKEQKPHFISDLNDELSKSLAFAWNNLSFTIKSLFNEKLILKNLRGTINFGTITALMGPSGAGKTTLLRCINGINRSGLSKDTEIYINKSKKIKSVFIVQDQKHHLLMNITVRESLTYSSLLKNNNLKNQQKKNISSNGGTESLEHLERIALEQMEFNHKINVNKILSELMLTNCADNKVSNCSGGEQKRLSIGLELTPKIKPNLICIDEPTSGLDSHAAEQVYNLVIV